MKYYIYFISQPSKLSPTILEKIALFLRKNNLIILAEEILADSECYSFLVNLQRQEISFLTEARNIFAPDQIDVFLIKQEHRNLKKLLIADMDSTIIKNECIDEIAKYAKQYDKVKEVTEAAMNGKLDFTSSLKERVSLLKDVSLQELEEIYQKNIILSEGAEILGRTLKKYNCYLALASGGFQFFTNKIRDKIYFDEDHSNNLEIKNNILTGKLIPPIFDNKSKLELTKNLQKKLNLSKDDTICVGDGANDIPMLENTNFGIAYKAKEEVKKITNHHLNYSSLVSILYLQGIKKTDFIC
jgi:phosphoserine phosphatase